jgi:ribonucleoside-diphosphate reductase alpha chain
LSKAAVVKNNIFTLHLDTAATIAEVRRDKYMQPGETDWAQTCKRVAVATLPDDTVRSEALWSLLEAGVACPAGRVWAGAGTDKNVTMINCFVAPELQDSMRTEPNMPGLGIMDCLASVAYSMQMGGGVGTDFSPLRPKGALVKRVNAPASGPLPFMDMWNTMCQSIMSAGYRRGAMMATIRIDHPDVEAFITAKHDPSRLRMFNVSVLVTDAFMDAVAKDLVWELGSYNPPFDDRFNQKTMLRDGKPWYVYKILPARELWDTLMKSTYKYSEPGVIFIDRVNKENNLWYCENISCTNPCGEQPLPPNQNCNLSHVNLAKCFRGLPFTSECMVDYERIKHAACLLIRMGDNIIDLTPWPTEAQKAEAMKTRRIGLGFTGLADLLMFLRVDYRTAEARNIAGKIMKTIRDAAYSESVQLAKEKGPFPAFEYAKYIQGPFVRKLSKYVLAGIKEYGIRNSHLLTIAPVGTVSIAAADNVSSGIEPCFSFRYNRKILQPDNTYKEGVMENYAFRVFANTFYLGEAEDALRDIDKTDYMVTTKDLKPEHHIAMQAVVQEYVDSSISKTVNLPAEISFEDFKGVYAKAYELGCKGCTTYRPEPTSGRGEILSEIVISETGVTINADSIRIEPGLFGIGSETIPPLGTIMADPGIVKAFQDTAADKEWLDTSDEAKESWIMSAKAAGFFTEEKIDASDILEATEEWFKKAKLKLPELRKRPEVLKGETYKLDWASMGAAMYMTINDEVRADGSLEPYEVFINTKAAQYSPWIVALTRMISAVMRKGGDLRFIPEELSQVHSSMGGQYVGKEFVPSEIALIGIKMMEHFRNIGYAKPNEWLDTYKGEVIDTQSRGVEAEKGGECPACHRFTLYKQEGCDNCTSCGYNKCGG